MPTRFRSVFMEIFEHSSRSASVWSDTDLGLEDLAHSLHSNPSKRCSVRLTSTFGAGQSGSSAPIPLIHVFRELIWNVVHTHVGTGRSHPQTVPTTKGLSPASHNNPLCTKRYT
ncbi:hypothetical protein ATANTOWER_009226 [Ataeniobius toweri]|uniref:Uncharacterized protein n=1 Tax=Ataeniobius toweri TaxID=208326 RepID=A0ABU7BZP4_9TELE|nr:hypothetical protein [Ataeniobius toweri]